MLLFGSRLHPNHWYPCIQGVWNIWVKFSLPGPSFLSCPSPDSICKKVHQTVTFPQIGSQPLSQAILTFNCPHLENEHIVFLNLLSFLHGSPVFLPISIPGGVGCWKVFWKCWYPLNLCFF